MIGRIIFFIYALSELILHIKLWGKKNKYYPKKVGVQTIIGFIADTLIVAVSVIYW